MSILTEALEKIINWLQVYQPEYAAFFLPKLTFHEIKAKEEKFGLKLSEEIYELYQWRNGSKAANNAWYFPNIQFLPLDEALNISNTINSFYLKDRDLWNQENPFLVFLLYECDACAIAINNNQQKDLPVVYIAEGEMPKIVFTSLTNMMLTLAECYETGAYYLDDEGFIGEDEDKAAQIFRKYNASVDKKLL